MKITLYPYDAIAFHRYATKKVEINVVFMGGKNTRKGFWLEITTENKMSFYDSYAEVGFEMVRSFWGGYGGGTGLKFDSEIFEMGVDIFEFLRENRSQAPASGRNRVNKN
jgi:hypothetical protein